MRGTASESAATPVSHNAADPVKLNDLFHTKLKLPDQTDQDAALLPDLIHQLGSAHEWSGLWIRPQILLQLCAKPNRQINANKRVALESFGTANSIKFDRVYHIICC